jgi:hypothetical protein
VRNRSLRAVAATLLSLVPAIPLAVAAGTGTAHAARPTSAYVPLPSPTRLVDTRQSGAMGAGTTINVRVTDGTLPSAAGTTAVVLNLTVVGLSGVGFWTAYAHGAPRPLAASLYVDERASLLGAGLAMPNLVTVPVGADGTIDIFSQSGGHVVVDMLGSYVVTGATTAGRLQTLSAPQRILDTRTFLAVPPATTLPVPVPNANGASAAVLTVTTIAQSAGYWTFFPTTSSTPPTAANLNSLFPLHIAANQVIVPLDAQGRFNVFSQSGGHLIVDLVGFITGPGAAVSTEGLFVPLDEPTRFLDTRNASTNPLGGSQMALPGWNFEVPVTANPLVGRPDVAAVALNVTVTDPLSPGYVTLTPAGANDPAATTRTTATVSVVRAAQTLPSHAIVGVSPRGFDVFVLNGAHVIADVTGYFLGAPAPAPFPAPTESNPTPFGCPGFASAPVGAIITGSSRASVMRLQQRLLDLGFWLAGVDGQYGLTTSQAVMAFQKWHGLPRTTVVDETTAARMNTMLCRPTPGASASGDMIEVDKGKQLLFLIRGGRIQWVLNTSTGSGETYTYTDRKTGQTGTDTAITHNGMHRVYRVSDEVRYESTLGILYRPRFIVGGVAVHGYSSVPAHPASHGCIRVTNAAMDMIWGGNFMPMGQRAWVHE